MTSSDRLDLRARCVRVVQRPVPQSLSGASVQRCEQYKADIADCIQYSRTGKGLAKARFAVSRLEGIQRGAQ